MVGSVNAPEPGFRPGARWGWCHGGVLQSVGRSEALPSMPALPGCGPGPGGFLSVVRSDEHPRRQYPRALEGQGHMAIRGRPIGGPSGLGQTVGHAPNARHRSSSAVYLRLQWAQPSLWCRVPVTAFRPRSGAAPPGSGRLSRRDTAARGALCWRRLRRSPFQTPTPGSGLSCRKTGSNLTPFREFWAVISVPRRDSCRWLRYNPRSEAFTSSMSRSAAYETAQNSARALPEHV